MIFRVSAGPEDASADPEAGGPDGLRPLCSLRTPKTVDWHRLDAALAGSWSYFGTPVPGKKSDFLGPGTDFWRTGPVPGPALLRAFWPREAPRTCILTIQDVVNAQPQER